MAAGLALSGTLQNFTSGVLILLLKPFQVGDNIIAQGQEGTVAAIKIFYTVITTFDNRKVVIPNSKISNSIDFTEVKKNIEQALDRAQNTLQSPIKRIGISSIEPDGYKIMVG